MGAIEHDCIFEKFLLMVCSPQNQVELVQEVEWTFEKLMVLSQVEFWCHCSSVFCNSSNWYLSHLSFSFNICISISCLWRLFVMPRRNNFWSVNVISTWPVMSCLWNSSLYSLWYGLQYFFSQYSTRSVSQKWALLTGMLVGPFIRSLPLSADDVLVSLDFRRWFRISWVERDIVPEHSFTLLSVSTSDIERNSYAAMLHIPGESSQLKLIVSYSS